MRADRPAGFLEWAAEEMRRHDVRMLTEAARSITRFDSSDWIADIDVPTAVLRTNRDRLVDPARQTAFVTASRAPVSSNTTTVTSHAHGHLRRADAHRLPRRRLARQRLNQRASAVPLAKRRLGSSIAEAFSAELIHP